MILVVMMVIVEILKVSRVLVVMIMILVIIIAHLIVQVQLLFPQVQVPPGPSPPGPRPHPSKRCGPTPHPDQKYYSYDEESNTCVESPDGMFCSPYQCECLSCISDPTCRKCTPTEEGKYYSYDEEHKTCVESSDGIFCSQTHCQCLSGTNSGPECENFSWYACGSDSGSCIKVSKGNGKYTDLDSCRRNCSVFYQHSYSCNEKYQCQFINDTSGDFWCKSDCEKTCKAPPTPISYMCNYDTHVCEKIEGTKGDYTDLDQCNEDCQIPWSKIIKQILLYTLISFVAIIVILIIIAISYYFIKQIINKNKLNK